MDDQLSYQQQENDGTMYRQSTPGRSSSYNGGKNGNGGGGFEDETQNNQGFSGLQQIMLSQDENVNQILRQQQ